MEDDKKFDDYCIISGRNVVFGFDSRDKEVGEPSLTKSSKLVKDLKEFGDFNVGNLDKIRNRIQENGVNFLVHGQTVYGIRENESFSEAPGHMVGRVYANFVGDIYALI